RLAVVEPAAELLPGEELPGARLVAPQEQLVLRLAVGELVILVALRFLRPGLDTLAVFEPRLVAEDVVAAGALEAGVLQAVVADAAAVAARVGHVVRRLVEEVRLVVVGRPVVERVLHAAVVAAA